MLHFIICVCCFGFTVEPHLHFLRGEGVSNILNPSRICRCQKVVLWLQYISIQLALYFGSAKTKDVPSNGVCLKPQFPVFNKGLQLPFHFIKLYPQTGFCKGYSCFTTKHLHWYKWKLQDCCSGNFYICIRDWFLCMI